MSCPATINTNILPAPISATDNKVTVTTKAPRRPPVYLYQLILLYCARPGTESLDINKSIANAIFVDVKLNVADLAEIASKKLKDRDFSDLAYTEPAYLKNVYTGNSK